MNILIENISRLLTMDSGGNFTGSDEDKLGIVDDASICIEDEIISWAGAKSDLPAGIKTRDNLEIVDAAGRIVMPGLIDAHTHLVFAGSRENEFASRIRGASYEEILAAGGGIHSTVAATRKASADSLFDTGMKRLDFCLDHGITTVEVKSGYGLETDTEIKMLQTAKKLNEHHQVDIVPTFLGAHVIPKEFKQDRPGYIDKIINEMLPEIAAGRLAEYCDVFIEEGAYTAKEAELIISAFAEKGVSPRLHIDQFNDIGGVDLAVEYNAASVDHLEAISPENINKLAEAGIAAVILPGATFFLRMDKYAPARELIDAGVSTVLATDFNPGSCMTQMPFLIMTLGCLQMGMTPAETLTAFTRNAALSLDRPDRGVIKKGFSADIIILDVDNYKAIPYHFGKNHVTHVFKNGKLVRRP